MYVNPGISNLPLFKRRLYKHYVCYIPGSFFPLQKITVDINILLVSGVLYMDFEERGGIWIVEGKRRPFTVVCEGQVIWKWI